MTTITARDGVMAGDSRITDGDDNDTGFVVSGSERKIFRLRDGRLFGGSGDSEEIDILKLSLKKNHFTPHLSHVNGIVIFPDKTTFLYQGKLWTKIREPFYAIGSGAGYAMAAMYAGADAIEACKIGAMMDPFSGGRIRHLKIRK